MCGNDRRHRMHQTHSVSQCANRIHPRHTLALCRVAGVREQRTVRRGLVVHTAFVVFVWQCDGVPCL
jgi:hypothetical protein